MKTITRSLKKLTAITALVVAGFTAKSQSCTAMFNFSYQPNGGVIFTSNSTPVNSITTQYYWTFGNGTSFTATGNPNASVNYTANGTYTVTLFFLTPNTCSNSAGAVVTITNVSTGTCNINANF